MKGQKISIDRTSKGLSETMFRELDSLENGESTPQMARAKAAVANTICAVSRLEMDYARFVGARRADLDNNALKALPMGSIEDEE